MGRGTAALCAPVGREVVRRRGMNSSKLKRFISRPKPCQKGFYFYINIVYYSQMLSKVFLVSLGILFSATTSFANQWNLDDVTYIFPLPSLSNVDASIRATDLDSSGQAIISFQTLDTVSGSNFDTSVDANTPKHILIPGDVLKRSAEFDAYKDLFLVALRVDPCFKDKFTDKCRKQIRAVWQPVDKWRSGNAEAADAAVHTFYDFNDKDFEKLTSGLQTLKKYYHINTDGLALGVHPAFSESAAAPFQLALRTLILGNISSARMTRMAMVILKGGTSWDLLSMDFVNGQQVPVKIFPDDQDEQGAQNIDGIDAFKNFYFPDNADQIFAEAISSRSLYTQKDRGFMGNPLNTPEQGDQLLSVAADSRTLLSNPAKAQDVFLKATRVEDPSKNLPGTVDCVSCHIANAVKLISNGQNLKLPIPAGLGNHNLINHSKYYGDTHQLRMLGYVMDQVQIADRSIYEAASVADYLNHSK
jgi:hypothetical protein